MKSAALNFKFLNHFRDVPKLNFKSFENDKVQQELQQIVDTTTAQIRSLMK